MGKIPSIVEVHIVTNLELAKGTSNVALFEEKAGKREGTDRRAARN